MKELYEEQMTMNTGKIMMGFSLVILSIAMMISPSGATGQDNSCDVGCGIDMDGGVSDCPAGMHPGFPVRFWSDEPCTNATYPYER